MLHPSIDSLMEKINSKYTLVTISAARARDLLEQSVGTEENEEDTTVSYVSKALVEVDKGIITVAEPIE